MKDPDPAIMSPDREQKVTPHHFRIRLSGTFESIEDIADKLFDSGCDDALFGTSNGEPDISFTREAPSLIEAIRSAMRDVRNSNLGLEVARVEAEEATTPDEADELVRLNESLNVVNRRDSSQASERLGPKSQP
jgi:hypothetical protein